MTIELIEGDCREVLREFADNSIDSVVTDPPYALTTGKKGGSGPKSVNLESPYGRARITTGFMGKAWDNGDTAFDPAFWADVLRVLKPGGHVLSFGGTRTYHRMACAIEDAGFEIRDQIGWLYGSGFPKSSNQDGEWEGWGTALKPAWEPIVVARKPLIGTNAQNLARWGVGALNIDGCRVGDEVITTQAKKGMYGAGSAEKMREQGFRPYHVDNRNIPDSQHTGRWPANVIHDGSDEVLDAFPDAKGQQGYVGPEHGAKPSVNTYGDFGARPPTPPRGDSGSAARFFYCAKASRKDRDDGLAAFEKKPLLWSAGTQNPGSFQSAGTEKAARNPHPTVKPTDLMRYLVRLVTPPGGTVLDPFMGSGSTGRGAVLEGFNFIGIEMSTEYMDIADARIAAAEAQAAPVMQAAE